LFNQNTFAFASAQTLSFNYEYVGTKSYNGELLYNVLIMNGIQVEKHSPFGELGLKTPKNVALKT
jgi:hypothetical protein